MHSFPRFAACILLALAGACRADGLTDRAIQAFHALDPTLVVTVKGDDELSIARKKGEPAVVYLDNLRKTCATRPDECDAATTLYAQRMAASFLGDTPSAKFSTDKVYPVLRRAGYAAQAMHIVKDPAKGLVMLPLGPDIEQLFIIDSENAIRYVSLDEPRQAGLTTDALLAAGSANAARLATIKPTPLQGRDGLFALIFGDSLGSARMFDAALWDRIEADAGGPVAVAVPTRDWILFTRLDAPGHVAALHELAGRIAKGEAYGVSGAVLRRDGRGWVPVAEH